MFLYVKINMKFILSVYSFIGAQLCLFLCVICGSFVLNWQLRYDTHWHGSQRQKSPIWPFTEVLT